MLGPAGFARQLGLLSQLGKGPEARHIFSLGGDLGKLQILDTRAEGPTHILRVSETPEPVPASTKKKGPVFCNI